MGVKEITDRLARLRERLGATASSIEATAAEAREAEIAGRKANGRLEALAALAFRRDTLSGEIDRIEREELPAAEAEVVAVERARHLGLARRIHANMVEAAGRADAALAAFEKATAAIEHLHSGYGREMRAAGIEPRLAQWSAMLLRAAWASAPGMADRLGLRREHKARAETLAAILGNAHAPPAGTGVTEPSPQN